MMNIEQLIFYLLAAVMLVSALAVVMTQNLVRSIFLFFVTLFAVAGLYVFSLADFVAVTQVIIYVGGVLVLMLFAFMLSNKELLNSLHPAGKTRLLAISAIPAVIVSLAMLWLLIRVTSFQNGGEPAWVAMTGNSPVTTGDNTIHLIGIQVMTRYLLPFEVVSVFLMMALVGAAHLARKGGSKA